MCVPTGEVDHIGDICYTYWLDNKSWLDTMIYAEQLLGVSTKETDTHLVKVGCLRFEL